MAHDMVWYASIQMDVAANRGPLNLATSFLIRLSDKDYKRDLSCRFDGKEKQG
jgi:hypothetical protein